jgi:hypothetical protein
LIHAPQNVDDINNNELGFDMMRQTASLWARIATQKSLLRGKNVLTLEHVRSRLEVWDWQWLTMREKFMQKKKALSLWREIMRAISSMSIKNQTKAI